MEKLPQNNREGDNEISGQEITGAYVAETETLSGGEAEGVTLDVGVGDEKRQTLLEKIREALRWASDKEKRGEDKGDGSGTSNSFPV